MRNPMRTVHDNVWLKTENKELKTVIQKYWLLSISAHER